MELTDGIIVLLNVNPKDFNLNWRFVFWGGDSEI